MYVLSFC